MGRWLDRGFRPVMGWATAWSFDRLRLWLERGLPPERTFRIAGYSVFSRVAVVVALLGMRRTKLALVAGIVLAFAPPMHATPAARRCRRAPPDGFSATAPTTLKEVERS